MSRIACKAESYKIAGVLFEVYNNLGNGFSKILYQHFLDHKRIVL